MAIDFTLPPDVVAVRERVRAFMEQEVAPAEARMRTEGNWRKGYAELREEARRAGLWAPHMPPDLGGMGLGPLAMAFVSAECGRTMMGAYVLNCHAPDEGNMHTMLHFATPEQRERYLRPLVDGKVRSCFAMTEPEVAGSDPTGIRTTAVRDGDDWVLNGHKWFISGARGAAFAIVIARTDPDADPPQARNSAFIVETDKPGFNIVRDVETMAGHGNHCEIRFENVRVANGAMLGGRGQGHRLGQVRLGPARLAHCMRWIGNAEVALEMLTRRALERPLHGGVLADKQLVQAMMAESALELYAAKLMVLHAAYLIEKGMPFRQEVSMAKHHVANMLWKITDRAIQVHGALGYSTDTPLERMLRHARSARLVDGADEVHLSQIAANVMAAVREDGTSRRATGLDLL
jgi:acyl-CoA dehydrogenase